MLAPTPALNRDSLMRLIPPRLWASPLTRAYEAAEYRAARDALIAGIPLAALALALALLGRLDPLTMAMSVAVVGLMGWALGYEVLIWRRFGAGSLYMAWARRHSRGWWRRMGLSNRSSPERASAWLERHADEQALTADRVIMNAVLGRSAHAHAEIRRLGDATPAERWASERLRVLVDYICGSGQPDLEDYRRRVAELGDPRERVIAETDLVGFEVGTVVAAGGDWVRDLRLAVERVNQRMVAAGRDEWRFRLRTYDWAAYVGAGLVLLVLTALLIAVIVTSRG
jgi:hypothetical protein